MRVALPRDFDVLLGVARCRDGGAGQRQIARPLFLGVHGGDGDGPARLAGGGVGDGDVASSGDEGARQAVPRQDAEHFVGGVALGDAAEVEPHARFEEANGLRLLVDLHEFVADERPRGGEFLRVGQLPRLARLAPELDDGADRDIESAAGFGADLAGTDEDREQFVGNSYRRATGSCA